ncbi:cysteine hydrolase [Curvibacter sp. CHRR-16]|uniref:cysteine hydrolase family protein n=1 Tax=Curvibacter sp. CHRR-16 TaxID=2835872 RepID=UPI001BDAE8B8|nr:cysteine hydrolase family protein [Curvibacter sp. CHRR-16]MBT0571012.1 cysteine hydrolase [Curvibacter sp. CHRR-16]
MTQALLLIDIQNDYFPGGAMELVGAEAALMQADKVLQHFRQRGLPVFHVQHIAKRAGATFFLPDTHGASIHRAVHPIDGEHLIVKHFTNSFRQTDLLEKLRNAQVTDLVVAGMMTQQCVDTAVRAATDFGFACTTLSDACATRDLSYGDKTVAAADVQTAYMASLNGPFGKVLTTAEWLG